MELKLTRCTIRPWRHGDEASLARYANNRNIWRNLRDTFPHPYTLKDAEQWIRSASAENPPRNFAIIIEGEAAGGIGFVLKNDVYRNAAEIGYWLGEEFWGCGIITEAVHAMTEYAFANFDICRIQAGVYEWNPASMRVLEKAGYALEARLRKSIIKDGEMIDELIYAIMRPDRIH